MQKVGIDPEDEQLGRSKVRSLMDELDLISKQPGSHAYPCLLWSVNCWQQKTGGVSPTRLLSRLSLNPVMDLILLCPNCHAIVHKRAKAMSLDEL